MPPSWSDPREVPEPPPFDAPAGWVQHRDPWRGFRVYHPRGWRVLRTDGPTLVSGDPGRRTAALLWPMPASSRDAAALPARFVQWKQERNPSVRAWQAGQGGLLRLTEDTPQGPLETQVQIQAGDGAALLSGLQAPRGAPREALDDLVRIVASFALIPALPRYLWVDGTEGAFAAEVPTGWAARGGVSRNNAYGMAECHFEAWGDATGSTSVTLSGRTFQFFDGGAGGGLLGALAGAVTGMGGPPSMPWKTAGELVRSWILPGRQKEFPDAVLAGGEDRPDLAFGSWRELQGRGMAVPGAQVSLADFWFRFTRQGVRVLQQGRVQTVKIPVMSLMPAPQPWLAEIPHLLQAPEAEFGRLQPVLEGVADSVRLNPAWQAAHEAQVQGQIAATRMDTQRRLGEISRTLSETSDIVTGGWWDRQATTAHLDRDWSNAILGYEDRVSGTGEVYSVPSGHDRVFRDPQGNFYGGGWLVNPDPTWTELRPTR